MAGGATATRTSEETLTSTYSYLMLTQLISRGISFLFTTVWMTRHLSKEDFVDYTIKFHLFMTFIFVSREGFRRACMRVEIKCEDGSLKENAVRLLRISRLTLPLGLLLFSVACIFAFWHHRLNLSETYAQGFLIHGIACILELLAEPLYILSQNLLLLRLRMAVESMATLLRCVTIYVLMVKHADMEKSVIFALSQAAYGVSFFLGYWIYFISFHILSPLELFSFRAWDGTNEGKKLMNSCQIYTYQAFQKFLLREGEKMVILPFGTTYNQASYGLVDRLGSLVVRLVFLPFEESSYTTFARVSLGQSPERVKQLGNSLAEAIKLVTFIGFVVVAFGPSYSYSLLRILYGRQWSDGEASTALRFYCVYIIALAMNGTSEAFLHAVANKEQLQRSNGFMVVFSAVYVLLNIVLLRAAGTVGLIAANSLNSTSKESVSTNTSKEVLLDMTMRIVYSAIFIREYFQDSSFDFRNCLPSGWVVLLFSAAITFVSERLLLDRENFWPTFSLHLSVGITCLCISLSVIYHHEKRFIGKVLRLRKHAD